MQEATSAAAEMATYGLEADERYGFFTDTTLCIGCKACEVACKEWNELPQDGYNFTAESYDNTSQLSGTTWRHVAFIEQFALPVERPDPAEGPVTVRIGDGVPPQSDQSGRWLMSSDVCKHCAHAACLDVCPTGALFRTEFGSVVVQQDICNGCGYCVPACPFGVIEQIPKDGRVGKCTLCYDRLKDGESPACAKACPTESIQFGKVDELRERAQKRLAAVQNEFQGAQLYGADEGDGIGGAGAFFLLLDKPEVYGLPPDPVVTTRDVLKMWKFAAWAAATTVGVLVLSGMLPD